MMQCHVFMTLYRMSQGPEGNLIVSAKGRMKELRRMVIVHGLPHDSTNEKEEYLNIGEGTCSLRGCIWKLLLGVEHLDAKHYLQMMKLGPSRCDEDIRNDTFRTFTNDLEFASRVPEEKLARILNAFVHEMAMKRIEKDHPPSISRYVQGMNILSGPLLYVMPEVDAYFAFCQLITKHCPRYVSPHLEGVHAGCQLVDECLDVVDPQLYAHLYSRGLAATIYAFPLVLSLFACSPPLHQLLRVWDVLMAFGVHLNVLLCVSHVVLMREKLLRETTILQLRQIPPLDANLLVSVAFQLLQRIPDTLYHRIVQHPYENLSSEKCNSNTYSPRKGNARFFTKSRSGRRTKLDDQKNTSSSEKPPWR